MVTSEYSFCYEPYRRVPMNSATTQKDWPEFNSIGTHSTYTSWSKSMKPTIPTKYIDGMKMPGQHDGPYNMKDLFPKSKGRQKPFYSSQKKDAREAYMSLLPVDAATIRFEKSRSPMQASSLPELVSKSANSRNKRSLRTTILDDDSQSKFYAPCATTNVNGGWVRRYKSINESLIISDYIRDRLYENKISIKKRPCQQLFVSSSTSSFNKRRLEKCG